MAIPPTRYKSFFVSILITGLSYFVADVTYAEEAAANTSHAMMLMIAGLMGLQTLLIIGLQRSRLKNKGAKNTLKIHQRDLELKIQERTQSLHQKNIELETAIQNHKVIAMQLQDTKRHLQTMINSVPEVLVGVANDGTVTYWNTAAFEKTGLSFDKALGSDVFKALPHLPITPEQLSNIIKTQKPFNNQHIQQIENDEHKFYDLRIYPLASEKTTGAVIQLNDVTKRVQIENMMIQNEKMSSMGELAAGIAHEINNPLGIILHNVQNIVRRTSANLPSNIEAAKKRNMVFTDIRQYLRDREVDQFLDNIKEAGERAGSIVTNMLEFSRTNYSEKSWVDLRNIVDQCIQLNVKAGFADKKKIKAISITTKYSNDFPLIYVSAPELQQVLLNLLRNAYQALISDDYEKPEELTVGISAYTRKNEIVIEISDNGPGIKDNIKDHIFEPFFTTKDFGKGTGLGLSVSYFIISEHHKGTISVTSQYGKGATFKIRLPMTGDRQFSLDI